MEQRKTRRFSLQLPLAVTRTGISRVEQSGLTRNISSGGVLFVSSNEPDVGGPIEYVITLNPEQAHCVNLRCIGKVVRFEKLANSNSARQAFAVAATLERYEFVRTD